jgi:hypothetical protein
MNRISIVRRDEMTDKFIEITCYKNRFEEMERTVPDNIATINMVEEFENSINYAYELGQKSVLNNNLSEDDKVVLERDLRSFAQRLLDFTAVIRYISDDKEGMK